MMWWLLLTGCWEPTETSASGMVGRILDNTGFPVADAEVTTLEGRAITDADGRFAVEYQAPDTYIGFQIGASHFRRTYRAEDDGQSVDIRIPRLREVQLTCDVPCDGRARWDLGDGLTVRTAVSCDTEGQTALVGVPAGSPVLECRGIDATLREDGDVWRIEPASRRVSVSGLPADCRVSVGDVLATREGDVYVATATGTVAVRGQCDGVPFVPQRVSGDAAAFELGESMQWTLDGVSTDRVDLLAQPAEGESWTVSLTVSEGVVTTPALPAGHYAFLAPDALPMDRSALIRATADRPPNTLYMMDAGRTASWVMHRD